MIRKFAVCAFAAAVLTVFATGTSLAGGDKDKKAGHDRAGMSQDRTTGTQDGMTGMPGASGMSRDRSGMKDKEVKVDLRPAPKVSSQAKGETEFEFKDDGKTLSYKIEVEDIKDVTQAHVHMVKPDGSAGEVIAPLYPAQGTGALPSGDSRGAKEGEISGKLTEGTITDQQLTGPLQGKTTQDLYEMLRTGKAGVNVHTKANPVGEIWGTARTGRSGDRQ